MANIKSAKKRIDVINKKTAKNKANKSEIKTYLKKFDAAIEAGDKNVAVENFKVLERKLGRAAGRNLLHKNAVARRISSMQRRLNAINE